MASNSISGPNFGRYDPRHIGVSQRLHAQSIAPNVLRELKDRYELDLEDLDVEELLELLTQDQLQLSEDAIDYLKRHKKRKKKRGRGRHQNQDEDAFMELLEKIDEEEIHPPVEIPSLEAPKPFLPPVITLSTYSPSPLENTGPVRREGNDEEHLRLGKAGRLAIGMVAICPSKTSAKKVAKDLEVFGTEVMSEVKQFGTSIIVVSPNESLTSIKLGGLFLFGPGEKTHDGRDWSTVRGAYSSKRRVIVLGEELLDESWKTGRSVVRHEFAHAYEDVWSTKRQRKFPLGVELWYRFEKTRRAFITPYAATKPAEYFAESVEAFCDPTLRTRLLDADPDMYNYLEQLFSR